MRYYLKNKDTILLEFEVLLTSQHEDDHVHHEYAVKIISLWREKFFNDMSGLIHSQSNDVVGREDSHSSASVSVEYEGQEESPKKFHKEYRSAFKASKEAFSADHVSLLSTVEDKKKSSAPITTKKTLVNEEMDLFMDPFTGFYDNMKNDSYDVRREFIRCDSYGDKKVDEIYLPYGVTSHSPTLDRWLRQRCFPRNKRRYGHVLLDMAGEANPFAYLRTSYGLALQDTFWVCPVDADLEWDQVSPYRNEFNRMISEIAFTGDFQKVSSEGQVPHEEEDFSHRITVEYTTDGGMKKFWRRIVDDDGVHTELVKGSSPRYEELSRGGLEALMEVYVSQLADHLGLPHVAYWAERLDIPGDIKSNRRRPIDGSKSTDDMGAIDGQSQFVSVCSLFTSEDVGFVPLRVMYDESFFEENPVSEKRTQRLIAKDFGEDLFADMMVFDALIGNSDRHMGNMGLLVDNESGQILGPAPFFDHGCSLFYRASKDDWKNLATYVDPLSQNRTYWGLEFSEQAKEYVQERHVAMLEKVKRFTFTPVEEDLLSKEDLRHLEAILCQRAENYIGYARQKI